MLSHILGAGAVFAFADDIAVCIRSMSQLAAIHGAFRAFSAATSLRLKPAKCILIPLRMHQWDEATQIAAYADLLARIVPEWKDFQIRSEAEYLGSVIGPRATTHSQWKEPTTKYEDRVRSVTSSTSAPSLMMQYHAAHCAAVLGYTAQLRQPSDATQHDVYVAHQRMLRFPLKALPQGMVGQMSSMGILAGDDPLISCAAARMRAALSMRVEAEDAARRLQAAREDHSALCALGDPAQFADRLLWAAPAVSDVLGEAIALWDRSDAAREAAQAEGTRQVSQRQCYAVAWSAQRPPPPHVSRLPRLRRWLGADRVPTPTLEAWAERAVASVAQTAPTFGVRRLGH